MQHYFLLSQVIREIERDPEKNLSTAICNLRDFCRQTIFSPFSMRGESEVSQKLAS